MNPHIKLNVKQARGQTNDQPQPNNAGRVIWNSTPEPTMGHMFNLSDLELAKLWQRWNAEGQRCLRLLGPTHPGTARCFAVADRISRYGGCRLIGNQLFGNREG